ncbi:MAG: enoyl-CoA hydratase [Pusillimonas sp.]|nr:enoyl-CoA hydratase [Pusillimonas sp.]MBC43681.1 enoyl-CoA hydratase [Pusillimonas sp.]|tara:strand:+ start:39003 stop:39812 length:810 start_codon:yes stop_codon:yes gene_type:complete
MAPVLITDVANGVLTITLNRPEARNALSPELLCRLVDAFDAFEADASLQVAILTGAGTQAFCSGGDLGTTLPLFSGARRPADEWDQRLLNDPRVRSVAPLREDPLCKPVIAAVNGVCVAAGAEILLGTDIRIATPQAVFGWPEVKHALIPFAGTLARLPRQVSWCQAMDLLLTGEMIGAEKALQLGLINEVVASEQLLERATQIARRVASNGPLAVREIKRVAREAQDQPLADAYALEDASYKAIMGSEDAQEGPRAFMEKRKPVFRGR